MNILLTTARVMVSIFLLFGLYACSGKEYYEFTTEEAEFVAYEKGQTLEFRDTSGVVHVLEQTKFLDGYYKDNHIFGVNLVREYKVNFESTDDPSFVHGVYVTAEDGRSSGALYIRLGEYQAPDPYTTLSLPTLKLAIDGKEYSRVYRLRAKKWREYNPPRGDTATMYFNKEHGLIQVQFPNGKSITRID